MSLLDRCVACAGLMLVAVGVAGCSSSLMPARTADDDLERVRREVLELRRQSAVAETELEHLRSRVAALEAALEERAEPDTEERPAMSEPSPPPPSAAPPAIEESDLAAPSQQALDRAGPAAEGRAAPTPAPAASQALTAAAQELYDRGYTLYHQNRYLDAEATFQRFLDAYGATELGDNAQYWIGECRYGRGDWAGALAAFQLAVERYPSGNKIVDALLKVGQSLEKLGDLSGAKVTYEEVLERYPESAAAVTARARRDALR